MPEKDQHLAPSGTCGLCNEPVALTELVDHFRLFHPDVEFDLSGAPIFDCTDDPFPQFEGRVMEMPCGRCGDPVLTKVIVGCGESIAQAWADDQMEFICVPCAMSAGMKP